jgi:hypothetical protein
MKVVTKLFREGDEFAVQTNADSEQDFHYSFVSELHGILRAQAPGADTEYQLLGWLGWYAEVVCKLRGYKADAVVQRVISAGSIALKDEDRVAPPSPPETVG